MRYLLSTLLLIIILIAGCETSSDLLIDPANTSNNSTNEFFIEGGIFTYKLMPLPPKSPLWQDSVLTMSQIINGEIGGQMIMEKYYISLDGDSIHIWADLSIPAGAFQGTETITMTVDDEFAAMRFYPNMVFQDTLKLSQGFEGLDLTNCNHGTVDFVFIDDDGTIEIIKKNGLQIIIPQGIVRVNNAKLFHFSRYGWVRKTFHPGFDSNIYHE